MRFAAKVKRAIYLLLILAVVSSIFAIAVTVKADSIRMRSVRIDDSTASAVTRNTFSYEIPSTSNIGSIKFLYCENSPISNEPCTNSAGFNSSAATLESQTGETGFTLRPTLTDNELVVTRSSSAPANVPATLTFGNITNPSTPNKTVYVRISTYSSEDATGASIDTGAVAFSTANNLAVSGYVPPFLIFCVGITVAVDCSTSQGDSLSFGELSTSQTRSLTSQFAGATNDPGGYYVYASGTTMTSGNNVIPALNPPANSQIGQSQFGLNLKSNTIPTVGTEVTGPGSATASSLTGQSNSYYFGNQPITTATTATDFNKFTSSYIVNISSNQKPGIYSTTVTYIAIAAF